MVSFTPYHAWGPDKGTRTCPICKYGWYHGILYFVGDSPNWADIKKWLAFLESESIKREKYLKVYFIYGNAKNYNKQARETELANLGRDLQLQKVALTFVPSLSDRGSEIHLNKVDQKVGNTFILYRRNTVFANFIDLPATASNFSMMSDLLDKNKNEYFDLPQPAHQN
ncbi:hypothetical protein [Mucilaginibacter myungsuensis]|uniref:Uncharacterized protein n=1 Tax=Mucilaginibacter myungsuensis TaxID=649104 RepID=A0A929KZY6_9SPHI|nr:hypothetical protein [Mucilaginibacter myungsuensis]MBE9663670.1 hypothetical protein [Mucilaginibacter myungsuensis]MDN3599006.1 hypothetical protein [Mucilaginibacter myungsuensis]